MDIRRLPASHGATWIRNGWRYFRAAPGLWVALTVIWLALLALSSTFPGGGIVAGLFSPVFVGGFMCGCAAQASDDDLRIEHLFAGFRAPHLGPLLGIGGISMAASFAILVATGVIALLVFPDLRVYVEALLTGTGVPLPAFGWRIPVLIALIALALYLPLTMALWFAPPLIVIHRLGVLPALGASFRGCLRNIVPFLVYGLIGLGLFVLSAFTLFLALIVLTPVFIASIYAATAEIYPVAPDSDAPVGTGPESGPESPEW